MLRAGIAWYLLHFSGGSQQQKAESSVRIACARFWLQSFDHTQMLSPKRAEQRPIQVQVQVQMQVQVQVQVQLPQQ